MMDQETYVNIKDLREQGWTLEEIAEETGWHPATISRRLKQGPPPAKRAAPDEAKDERTVGPSGSGRSSRLIRGCWGSACCGACRLRASVAAIRR